MRVEARGGEAGPKALPHPAPRAPLSPLTARGEGPNKHSLSSQAPLHAPFGGEGCPKGGVRRLMITPRLIVPPQARPVSLLEVDPPEQTVRLIVDSRRE